MKTCFNCKHLVSETYGDNFHEPMETEYSCGVNSGLLGEGDFVSITDDEWDAIATKSDAYLNQYIAERCSKYEPMEN
jgi:hypothetical protein